MLEKCTELLQAVPEGFTEASYLECIAAQGGLGVPLNIFLMQVCTSAEVQCRNVAMGKFSFFYVQSVFKLVLNSLSLFFVRFP